MSYLPIHAFAINPDDLTRLLRVLESTEDYVWISKNQRLRRMTLRGTPARLIDFAVPEAGLDRPLLCEVGEKTGRYDSAKRWQITVSRWLGGPGWKGRQQGVPPDGTLAVTTTAEADAWHLIARWDGGGTWLHSAPRLRSDLGAYDLPAVALWHWTRYYRVLERAEAESVAAVFAAETLAEIERRRQAGEQPLTLAEANRHASRLLYRAARDAGWRKLTTGERLKWGWSQMWVRADEFEARRTDYRASDRNRTGCGDYTLDAAAGLIRRDD